MNASELSKVIETVGRDRGIKREIIITALEQAILAAAQKKYGPNAQLEAHYNDETGEIDVFLFKKVVESEDEMLEEIEEIQIEEARKLDPEAQLGDELGVKVDTDFGRIDAQTAKQVIFQRVRDAEREIIYNEYIHRKGEIITGIARRVERGSLVIDLGKTDAILPRSGVIPGEQFRPGDRVQAFLKDVQITARGPQIVLSRTAPEYLIKLFEMEVPEIRDGLIEVKGCAREAGARAKIAVHSKDRDVDPVGACVGMKGIRVQNVIQELKGEKIDIIPWTDNPVMFVRSALSPADISSINVDETNQSMEIMVEDDQLSLAIGRKGQNVRLAAQLSGWKLDIISKSKLQKRTTDTVFNLQNIEGVNETLAHSIVQNGFTSVREIASAEITALQKIPGYETEESATELKKKAQVVIEKAGDILAAPEEKVDVKVTSFDSTGQEVNAASDGDAKAQAEQRLQEMMKEQNKEDAKEEGSRDRQ